MKVIKNIWKIACYPLLYLGVQLVVSIIYVVAAMIAAAMRIAIQGAMSGDGFYPEDLPESIMSQIDLKIPVVISVFVAFVVMLLILRKEWRADRLWNFRHFGPAVAFCLSLGFAMNILTNCVLALLPIQEQSSPIDDMVGNSLILDFFVFALAAPILEEIIFRGVVQRRLSKMMNLHGAIVLQAFIFGLIHMNLIQGAYAFVLGIFIGYVYHWYDSLWFACAIHISFNGTSILLMYLFGDAEVDLFYFMLVSLVFFAVSIASLRVFAKNTKAKISPKADGGFNRWHF